MSLRARLVAVVLVLIAAGLLASDVATAALLRSYLLRRVDDRLEAVGGLTARAFASRLDEQPPPAARPLPEGVLPPTRPSLDVQAALVDPDGQVVQTLAGPFSTETDAFTRLPRSALDQARAGRSVDFDVSSASGRWRARAEPLAGTRNVAVVVSSLNDVDATLLRLYWIAGIATIVLMGLAGVSALWLVRVGLRPLTHVADTADAVASGEVDRRVEVAGGYEVGAARAGVELRVRRAWSLPSRRCARSSRTRRTSCAHP